MKTTNSATEHAGGQTTIILDVRSIDHILDLDSSPFPGHHLHPEIAERIVAEAKRLPKVESLCVRFRAPGGNTVGREQLKSALGHYGRSMCLETERELHEIMRDGRISLLIGTIAVFLLLTVAELLPLLGDSQTLKAISEGLVIFYWVILWRPAEMLLYDHIRPRRRRRLARLLERAEVEIEITPGRPCALVSNTRIQTG
jgi:hypothetical protein